VGGIEDHVHLAFALSRKNTISALVETIKVVSSKWIKQQFPAIENFAWQHGYGAFSIGASELEKLVRYIDGQEEHHRKKTFQEEYRIFWVNIR
jgi:REP element-mobilizing transposase RayT